MRVFERPGPINTDEVIKSYGKERPFGHRCPLLTGWSLSPSIVATIPFSSLRVIPQVPLQIPRTVWILLISCGVVTYGTEL